MLKLSRERALLFALVTFSFIYRLALILHQTFPPGADIGLHSSVINSIMQQSGGTNFLWNYYHMGGGVSDAFPGYDIFASYIILFTGVPNYIAQALAVTLFSSLLVAVAFLITRKVWNESAALIVAFLVAVSRYDIEMLLWAGYPNVITLTLIPLAFYLLLEKNRFSKLPFLIATSLVCAAIFLTHSLSTVIFVAVTLATVFFILLFPVKMGEKRRTALEWIFPIVLGVLAISPFLLQAVSVYLRSDTAAFTGGITDIKQAILSTRILPLDIVLPLLAGVFLYFLFSKHYHGKFVPVSTVLLVLWWLIPTVFTQTYLLGFYTDYQRFLYFVILPVIILIGLGIYYCAGFLGNSLGWLLAEVKELPQIRTRIIKSRTLQQVMSHCSIRKFVGVLSAVFVIVAFLEVPIFVTPSRAIEAQSFYQVMTQPGYEAIQWVQKNTPANAVFLADAQYGWWLGGFAQRPTISGVAPQFLTSSREVQPALLTSRLLDTDYLVDNGLIQIREDGGYIGRHNPEFLAKLNNSYYPYPFFNFDNSEITVTLRNRGTVNVIKLSKVPVKDMYLQNGSSSASIFITWGNSLFNFTQETTVYQGVRFVNMTEKVSSDNPAVTFDSVNFILHTKGSFAEGGNGATVALVDANMNVAGQLIFIKGQPIVTQLTEDNLAGLGILYNLNAHSETELNFYAGVYEYASNLDLNPKAQSGFYQLMTNNTKTYADKVADFPLVVFNYRQAVVTLNASYIVIRDPEQVPRFAKDPLFSLVFKNNEVAIFHVNKKG